MIKFPSARKPRELADWIEAELLFGERESVSQTEVRGLLSDDLGIQEDWSGADIDEEFRPLQAMEGDEEALTRTIEEAFLLLETRAARVGPTFPLTYESGLWLGEKSWEDHLGHSFLVLLNLRVLLGLGAIVDHHLPAILFERLVATALANYVRGEAARFGVPNSDFEGNFEARSKALAHRMRERPFRPLSTTTPQQGDYGLDVVAWRLFDSRESKIVVLCQCGIGADYEGKCLQPRRWEKVIDFVCPPVTALAIPFEDFASEPKTRNLALDAGLLLDRSRIAKFARVENNPGLGDDIQAWIEHVLPQFYSDGAV